MKFLFIYISVFFFITTKVYSDISKKIKNNLEKTNNYSFKFAQQINKNKETGYCILAFNRKINCKYDNSGKILVSDGKNLIIKLLPSEMIIFPVSRYLQFIFLSNTSVQFPASFFSSIFWIKLKR